MEGCDVVGSQQGAIDVRAILASPVGMVDESRRRPAYYQSTLQSRDRQALLQSVTHGPADNAPGEEVQYDGQIQPSLGGPGVADIAPPLLIGAIAGKVLIKQIGRYRTAEG